MTEIKIWSHLDRIFHEKAPSCSHIFFLPLVLSSFSLIIAIQTKAVDLMNDAQRQGAGWLIGYNECRYGLYYSKGTMCADGVLMVRLSELLNLTTGKFKC